MSVTNNKCCAISQKTEYLKNVLIWLLGDRENLMTEKKISLHLHLTEVNGRKVMV